MLEFNTRNIVSGYIKQLLYSFNLPVCKVFESTTECQAYIESIKSLDSFLRLLTEDWIAIVKNYKANENWFVKVSQDRKITPLIRYRYNHFYPNLTKKLKLENDLYDSYTHTYLGNYLRFIRDFYNINLMSLYNCYPGELRVQDNFKYLLVPIKYNQKYSVFIKNPKIKYIITNTVIDARSTIDFSSFQVAQKKSGEECVLIESKPAEAKKVELDSGESFVSVFRELFREPNLKLIIQLPLEQSLPIVVLEGNYTAYQPYFCHIQVNYEKSGTGTNAPYKFEKEYFDKFNDNIGSYNFQLVNQLKLSDLSYPFADRLIEYLIGNVITDEDPISNNIQSAKRKLAYRYLGYSASDLKGINASFGIMDRFKALSTLSLNKKYKSNNQDLLGYIDKDIEGILNDDRYPTNK